MKQKNLILLVVAVGIGLAAAFLTAQLGAKPEEAAKELEKIVVVKQEMPVGTLIDSARLAKLVELKEVPAGTMPPDAFREVDLVKNKRLTRTLRAGEEIMPSDITEGRSIKIPAGKQHYAIPMNAVKAVAGFALPGSEVDIILSQTLESKIKVSQMLLRKMLVVAVDILDHYPDGSKPAVPQLNSISLAVTPREALLLALSTKNGELTLALRDREDMDVSQVEPVIVVPEDFKGEIPEIVNPLDVKLSARPTQPTIETVKLPVPKVDLEPGTLITPETAEEFFELGEFLRVPDAAVENLSDYYGMYLVKPIAREQFLPSTALAKEMPKPEVGPEVVPEVKPEVKPGTPKDYHTMRIWNGLDRGHRSATWEAGEDGVFRPSGAEPPEKAGTGERKPPAAPKENDATPPGGGSLPESDEITD